MACFHPPLNPLLSMEGKSIDSLLFMTEDADSNPKVGIYRLIKPNQQHEPGDPIDRHSSSDQHNRRRL